MLAKLLGWFWIIIGVLFLVKPQILKNRLQKKSVKQLKRIFFALAIFFGILFLTAGFKAEGFLSKLLVIFGIIAFIKTVFFIKGKAADKMIAWLSSQPLKFFRIYAVIYIILGLVFLLG